MEQAALPFSQSDVRRIIVFRALNLGDLLCSMPALRGLRNAFPHARISLLGLKSARPVVERFHHYLDELIVFPGLEMFPEQAPHEAALPDFYRRMRRRRFDLALQMHGDGTHSNDVVRRLGARHWVGFVPEGASEQVGRLMRWPDELHEIHRYLALLAQLGLAVESDRLEFPLTEHDRRSARRLLSNAGLVPSRTIILHPGARLASRRWPLERYIEVGRQLVNEGWQVAITGSPAEAGLARTVAQGIGAAAVDLCSATTLGELAAMVQCCRLLICNDTGISHVAAAVGAPSVVIASGSDVNRWAPLDSGRHPVLHASVACRPCAFDQCPVGHVCALAVQADSVLASAGKQLQTRAASTGAGPQVAILT